MVSHRLSRGGGRDAQRPPAAGAAAGARAGHLRSVRGGVTNSRLTATTVARGGAGFDTVRVRFRGHRDRYLGLAVESGVGHYARGEVRRNDRGLRVGAYPDGMVYVEARAAQLLHGPDDHRLVGGDDLLEVVEAARRVAGVGPGEAAVGRADLASELVFPDGREGLELLHAASYVDMPWLKASTEGGKREKLETVYWRNTRGRSIVLRLYDKGVETGQAAPGTWLRLERQRRFRKDRECTVEDVLASGLRTQFVGRELYALAAGVEDVFVCDRDGAAQALRLAYARGELTGEMLAKLTGYVVQGGLGLTVRTEQRWAATLRSLGIALNPNEGGASVVPVGDYLRAFCEPWEAAA